MPHHTGTPADISFGDVRALLQRSPGDASWEQLVQLLDAVPGKPDDAIVQYVLAHLSTWRVELKRAPASWIDTFLRTGEVHPVLRACTALHLDELDERLSDDHITQLAEHATLLDALHVLAAPYQEKSSAALIKLLLAPWASSLTTLDLMGNALGGEGLAQLSAIAAGLPRLRHLNLCNTALRAQSRHQPLALLHFLQSSLIQNLESLDLSSNELGWGTGESLANGLRSCKRLTHLVLERCDFISKDVPHLAHIMREVETLHTLSIAHNHLNDELLQELFIRARGSALASLDLRGNAMSLGALNTLAEHVPLTRLALGESTHHAPDLEQMHHSFDALEHLAIHGALEPVWRTLFEDVDALPQLTSLALMVMPHQSRTLDTLLDFLSASSVTHLHVETITASENLYTWCEEMPLEHLERLTVSTWRGPERWQQELLGIDWIARTLQR